MIVLQVHLLSETKLYIYCTLAYVRIHQILNQYYCLFFNQFSLRTHQCKLKPLRTSFQQKVQIKQVMFEMESNRPHWHRFSATMALAMTYDHKIFCIITRPTSKAWRYRPHKHSVNWNLVYVYICIYILYTYTCTQMHNLILDYGAFDRVQKCHNYLYTIYYCTKITIASILNSEYLCIIKDVNMAMSF